QPVDPPPSAPAAAPARAAGEAAAAIAERTGAARHDVAIVLASGWRPAADRLLDGAGAVARVPLAALPGFVPPTAEGHAGTGLSAPVGEHRVLILLGRTHAYEGHDLAHVVHPVRTACAAGAGTVVLTNAAGGLRADLSVGRPVLISDHLNLTGRSPLAGARFVDLTDAYDPDLRALCRRVDAGLAGAAAGGAGAWRGGGVAARRRARRPAPRSRRGARNGSRAIPIPPPAPRCRPGRRTGPRWRRWAPRRSRSAPRACAAPSDRAPPG